MSQFVADCPRCGTQKTSFNLLSSNYIKDIYFSYARKQCKQYEAFCVCRHCHTSAVFVITEKVDLNNFIADMTKKSKPEDFESVNDVFNINGYISLKDASATPSPEHLPDSIEAAFKEGATCFAVGCFNAAGTMFRLCVDLASKKLLPEGAPSKDTKMLAPRLKWLFEQDLISETLQDLSNCIKDDGNDGAHDGSLTKVEAEDLLEFTTLLLERIYTEPKKVQLAKERRTTRNSQIVM